MKNSKRQCIAVSFVGLTLSLSGCIGLGQHSVAQLGAADGPGESELLTQIESAQPRDLPKSRYGNPATYEVFGKQYHVMDSAVGYQQRGIASWYGAKFHGRKTSSGEVYDMYKMTAAHTSLPLPTFVSVRNLETNASVVVKVNDRGPFHASRIIDLSYAAAAELGMLENGTADVEVTAISRHLPAEVSVAEVPDETDGMQPQAELTPSRASSSSHVIQVGAFSIASNAESMRKRVDQAMQVPTAYIVSAEDNSVHRVRFGVAASAALNDVFAQLEHYGIENYSIISD